MTRLLRKIDVQKEAEWLVQIAVKESRARLALPSNDAPVGSDILVECLDHLLTSVKQQRKDLEKLRAFAQDVTTFKYSYDYIARWAKELLAPPKTRKPKVTRGKKRK